ncbi:MAG: transcriptional repressor [Acidimicrobiales bacterium]|nr:transcriptional repressor [Acidimicrobiales bacterium]
MNDQVHREITQQLRRSRQRYTLGRRQLVELLLDRQRPATIPELVDAGARQSQSSLYRNLAVLEQAGAVRRLSSVDDVARYELAEELTGHHHHLVCHQCGRIDDVTFPGTIERALGQAAEAANEQRGYAVDSHRFELVGTCPDCSD